MMKKITIILPIYKVDDDDIIMLNNAISSIQDFHNDIKLMVVYPSINTSKLDNFDFGNKLEVKLLRNSTSDSGFTNQINLGIDACDTEWFSILEIDDEYKPIWLSSMNEHMNAYKDVDVFLPIIKDVNVEGVFTNFTNESVWAYGFSTKLGYLDNELLMEFQNFQTSGGLYKTQVIKDHGKFKDNIKLTFSYEFLLRLTYHGVKIMSVPRAGYQHVNMRENSLFWLYKNNENYKLSEDEVKFWVEAARKEFFFKNKRDVTYSVK